MANFNKLTPSQAAAYERLLFTPCRSRKELHEWIKTFLLIDLPEYNIDENSTSTPIDFVWDVYSTILYRKTDVTTFVVAAARNTCKTLSAAILELLIMIHFGRDIGHLAATLEQSDACVRYFKKFVKRIGDLLTSRLTLDNLKNKKLEGLPLNPYLASTEAQLKVLVADKKGTNSARASVMVYDEVDLVDKAILSEASMVSDPDRLGRTPIFIYLSSRKSASGPIQDKIDQAAEVNSGVVLHSWSIVEFLQLCKPEVHKPDLPLIPQFIHKETLDIKSEDSMGEITDVEQEMFHKVESYNGCMGCPIFVVCRGRSPKQQGCSDMLRDIPFTRTLLREAGTPEQIIAQILNLRPESSGTIYNRFNKGIHVKPLETVYEFALNTKPPKNMNKLTLVFALKSAGWIINCGVDFGYVDPAAAVLTAYNRQEDKLVIIHSEQSPGFHNRDWLTFIKRKIHKRYGFDLLCPDTADVSAPSVASKMGMPARNKKPKKIETGVAWIRARLWSVADQSSRMMIVDDSSNKPFIKAMDEWQYKRNVQTNSFYFGEFDTDGPATHLMDALRYAIDPFTSGSHAAACASIEEQNRTLSQEQAMAHMSDIEKILSSREHLGNEIASFFEAEYNVNMESEKTVTDEHKSISSGNFYFSFGAD